MEIDEIETREILTNIKREKDEFMKKSASLKRQSNSMINALREKVSFQEIFEIDLQFDSNKSVKRNVKCGFFGKTSSGKSSCINALVGKKVMHTSKGVTTPCFVNLKGHRGKNLFLIDEIGNENPIESMNEIKNVINSFAANGVTFVKVLFPISQYPEFDHFSELIDTPGIDSSRMTLSSLDKYLQTGDIIVYVMDGECDLGVTDREFLKFIKSKFVNPTILFVINKWDRCDEEDNIEDLKKHYIETINNSLVNDLQYSGNAEEISFFISATESLNRHQEDNIPAVKQQRMTEFERFISVLQSKMATDKGHSIQTDYLLRLGENLNIEINIPDEDPEVILKRNINELIKETFDNINQNVQEKLGEHFSEFSFTKSSNIEKPSSSTSSIDDIINNILESSAYVELDELSNKIRTMLMGVCPFIIDKDRKKTYDLIVPRDTAVIENVVDCNDMNNYMQWRNDAIDQCSKYKFRAGLISVAICLMVKFHNFLNPINREKKKFEDQLRDRINKSVQKTLKDCQTVVEKDAISKIELFLKDYHELCSVLDFIQRIRSELAVKDKLESEGRKG